MFKIIILHQPKCVRLYVCIVNEQTGIPGLGRIIFLMLPVGGALVLRLILKHKSKISADKQNY